MEFLELPISIGKNNKLIFFDYYISVIFSNDRYNE